MYLKGAMLKIIQAFAALSQQQNSCNSMWELAGDLKVGPLDCARSALQTESNFILGYLKMKFSNTQQHLVVKYRAPHKSLGWIPVVTKHLWAYPVWGFANTSLLGFETFIIVRK